MLQELLWGMCLMQEIGTSPLISSKLANKTVIAASSAAVVGVVAGYPVSKTEQILRCDYICFQGNLY